MRASCAARKTRRCRTLGTIRPTSRDRCANISTSWTRPPVSACSPESPKPPKSLSLTDPSAALTSKGKSKIAFAYGTNYLIDTKAAIIVDVEASPARWTAEVAATRTMIDRAAKRFGLCPKRLAADTAYGSGGMLAWLMECGIEPHIPVLDRAAQTNGVFTRNDFTFDRERNVFTCPGGKDLRLGHERDNGMLLYRARSPDCAGCALKPQCTTSAYRSLSVNPHEEVRQHVASLAGTEAFKRSARERRKGRDAVRPFEAPSQLPSSALARHDRRAGRMHARRDCPESPQARQDDRLLAAAPVSSLRMTNEVMVRDVMDQVMGVTSPL
jgi:Transposase DDE domain